MKTQLAFVFLLFLVKHKVANATDCPAQRHSELNNYLLQGFNLESLIVDTVFECYRKCEDNIICASINMNLEDKTCELKHSTKTRYPEKIVGRQNTIYMEVRDALGFTPHNPILSCKWFKNLDNEVKSGVYWMKFNEPSSAPFQVFCDMTTDGGGWTLVYSYRITLFNNYDSYQNNMSPIPNWPVIGWSSSEWEPQSTTTPLSDSSHSAMDFALWKKIGNEFLLAPNITNWVACVEGTGSLVNWVAGSLTCRVVKAITPTCTTVAPNKLLMWQCGPVLKYNNGLQFILDGKTTYCFPTHDPCGSDSITNHLNVPSPGGAMYIR